MAVTQRDIAERLQLSRSLIAGVLNDQPGVYASEETRQRVLAAAREMNYRPHAAARALRSGKTRVVTLCCAGFNGLDQATAKIEGGTDGLLESLAVALGRQHYNLQVEFVLEPGEWTAALDEIATSRGSDAVVLWAEDEVGAAGARFLEGHGVSFVLKGYHEAHPTWPQFEFDHAGMMQGSVAHLAALGHRRIAFVGNDGPQVYARALENGFRAAMRQRDLHPGLMARDNLIISVRELVSAWLRLPASERPTALVLATNTEFSWRETEIALEEAGTCASETRAEAGGFGLCGLHPPRSPMLFGHAHAYDSAELGHLTDVMSERLLLPLLNNQPISEPVVRACPALHQLHSLQLHRATPLADATIR